MSFVQSPTMFHVESLPSMFYFKLTNSESAEDPRSSESLVTGTVHIYLSSVLFRSSFRKRSKFTQIDFIVCIYIWTVAVCLGEEMLDKVPRFLSIDEER